MTGFISGAACGLLFSSLAMTLGALYLLSLGRHRAGLLRLLPSGVAMPLVFLAISVTIPMLGALVGGLLGLAYLVAVAARPGAGLASPNLFFTLAVLLLALAPLLAWRLGRQRLSWMAVALGLSFALVFGWLLPWLVTT